MLTLQDYSPRTHPPLLGSGHDLDELRNAVLLPYAVDGLLSNVLIKSTSTASRRATHAVRLGARLAVTPIMTAAHRGLR